MYAVRTFAVLATTALAVALLPTAATAADTDIDSEGVTSFATAGDLDTEVAPTVGSADGTPATVIYSAPAAEGVVVTLDVTTKEQYWYWAEGVVVTAVGLTPGADVTITDTSPSGAVFTFDPAVADAEGKVTARLKGLTFDEELGTHQILVTDESGRAGAVVFDVVAGANKTLTVTLDDTSLTQDEFLDQPITIRVTGLKPRERLYINLHSPDDTGQELSYGQFFFADAYGTFTYQLQARTVGTPVGEWTVSVTSGSNQTGSADFDITPGAERAVVGTLQLADTEVTLTEFGTVPGIGFSLDGLGAFTAFDLDLTTPLGRTFPLGSGRVNGVGRYTDSIYGPTTAPTGTYTLRATSVTTGSYAEAQLVVTRVDGTTDPAPTLVSATPTITASDLNDAGVGLTVRGEHLQPSTYYVIVFRTSLDALVPLRAGQVMSARSDAGGNLTVTLSTRALLTPGTYTTWLTSSTTELTADVEVVTDPVPEAPADSSHSKGKNKNTTTGSTSR